MLVDIYQTSPFEQRRRLDFSMRIYANDPRFRQPVIEALPYELTLQENRIRVDEILDVLLVNETLVIIRIALRKAPRTVL